MNRWLLIWIVLCALGIVLLITTTPHNQTETTKPTSKTVPNTTITDRLGEVLAYQTDAGLWQLEPSAEIDLLLKYVVATTAPPHTITIDSELQSVLHAALEETAVAAGYQGAAGVIMDIETGELLAITSYSRDPSDERHRATHTGYIPGSVMKPFVALTALEAGVVSANTEILSTGALEIPHPTQPGEFWNYRDWRAHGLVDLREALGVSSNIYFYTIGGGHRDQDGVGIDAIITSLSRFGFGVPTGVAYLDESAGHLPTPAWKASTTGTNWHLGDTYMAAIGQHDYAVTPLQLTRAIAALGNGGTLLTPSLTATRKPQHAQDLNLNREHLSVIEDGMVYAVVNGTAEGLYLEDVPIAAKTGTAEVAHQKEFIHSWLTGYFPTETPRFAFVFMLDHGAWGTETGAVRPARTVFEWITENRPEYYLSPISE